MIIKIGMTYCVWAPSCDLISQFAGYGTVREVGTYGRRRRGWLRVLTDEISDESERRPEWMGVGSFERMLSEATGM
jgi:hypothetical protein